MVKNIIIIGIGYAGCKIVSELNVKYKKLFIDTDKDVIEKYNGLRIGEKICGEFSASGNINLAELSVRESKDNLLSAIENYNEIILIAPLGGGTSCGVTKKITELILDNNKSVKVFTSMPYDFEGRIRLLKAVKTFEYLKQLCEVIVVDKFDFSEFDKRINIKSIYDNQNKLFIKAIEDLY